MKITELTISGVNCDDLDNQSKVYLLTQLLSDRSTGRYVKLGDLTIDRTTNPTVTFTITW